LLSDLSVLSGFVNRRSRVRLSSLACVIFRIDLAEGWRL
jgi:hypothetical protein